MNYDEVLDSHNDTKQKKSQLELSINLLNSLEDQMNDNPHVSIPEWLVIFYIVYASMIINCVDNIEEINELFENNRLETIRLFKIKKEGYKNDH